MTTATPASKKAAVEAIYPLSPLQQGMVFHTLLEPAAGAYIEHFSCTLPGNLDVLAFRSAWQALVQRHAVLRTQFVTESRSEALQVVRPSVEVPWTDVDLRDLPVEAREAALQRFVQDDLAAGFALDRAPLLRLALVRLADDAWRFVWTYHHALLDGWSIPVILAELATLYAACRRGETPALPAPRPFRDHIRWLQQQDRAAASAFWAHDLAGFLSPTPLTVDRRNPDPAELGYGEHEWTLPADLTVRLQQLARRERLTLNTLVQGAWAILLARYSGETDVLFGATVSGRPATLAGVETMVGPFINTLPVRATLPADARLLPWLAALQTRQAERDAFSYSALVDIQRASQVPAGTALFDTLMVFENYPTGDALGADATLPMRDITVLEHTNYPLTVIVSADHAITIKLSFQNKRFAAATVARIARHFTTLLAAIANDPAQPVTALPLLDDAERSLVVETFNDTRADFPADRCIQHLFEDQARVTPNATALVFEDRALSYARLDAEANRLAHRLQALGVGPETLVGVCAERSLEMVVALLATLKAGGAYLPLDPAYPADRLGFMLDDAKVPVLLTQQHLLPNLPKTDARIVCLDRDATSWAGMPATKPATTVTADNLAYVIYTSGSTGRPKGAMLTHRGLCNLTVSHVERFGFDAESRVLQFASLSFDAATWEIFGTLATGGTLVLARRNDLMPGEGLNQLFRAQRISHVLLSPTALAATPAHDLPALRVMVTGGEACTPQVVEQWAPGRRLVNAYGPTEATVCVTSIDLHPGQGTPIGRPLPNTRIYVLDEQLQPVPVGVPGELHIGGVQVGRGYLNRPELTAQRFIADPFSSDPKARLYKTGDLARWLPDGTVDYLGRLDFQVKIRGFRIELGEIEAALARHPAVRDAVVLAREDRPGDKRLVAYVVGQPVDPIELRTHLRALLPDYMVPAAFVALEALPLNANGKLDRKALPAPDYTAPRSDTATPSTPTEAILADIVADVLGLDRVSPSDNFFERGGDSILLLQVIARARRAGLHLTARQVFEQQTIAGLAAVATTSGGVLAPQGAIIGPLPLTPIQHWFFDQQPPHPGHFNQSVLLRTDAVLQPDALRRALDHLVRHHDALRLRFHPADGVWQQHNAAPADTDVVLERRSDADVEAAAAEAQASLDLANGPLIRAILFPGRLFIAIHHLAVDGVSWRILLEDLATAYAQALAGTPVALPRKTSAFRDWALRLRQHAASDVVAAEAVWWERVADGATAALPVDLPADDDANTAGSVETVTVALDRQQTNALLHDVPPVYRTQINDVLLTALGIALTDWTGTARILIDLEGHGREPLFDDLDVSRTVGWFTSLFPVALDVADRDPGGALKSIKEQLRAIPNRGIGYGLLHYLRADALRDRPRAELCFNYLGQLDQADGLFIAVDEPAGPAHDPDLRRPHRIVVNSSVEDGKLILNWDYSRTLHRRATIERLAQRYVEALVGIIQHCRQPTAGGFTPSDFPEAKLDQSQLDLVTAPFGAQNIDAIYPLSPLQQGMVFHSVLEPGSGTYVEHFSWTLPADADVAAYRKAWEQLVQRHDILRSAFRWDGVREPLQIVVSKPAMPWTDVDLRDLPVEAREAALQRFVQDDLAAGFALDRAPLLRLALVRLADDAWRFVWTYHHALLDGWSIPVLLAELATLYAACRRRETPALPAPRPFRDHIRWLQQQDRAAASAFWAHDLAGFLSPTPLTVDRRNPDPAELGYGEHEWTLPADLTVRLQQLARRERLTLNTLVQGAWAILLARYSGETDVLFGATVSGRPATLAGVETMVGPFINTLPVRATLPADARLLPWLAALQTRQAERDAFSYSALVDIQRASQVPAGTALFDTLMVFENYPTGDALGADVTLPMRDITVLEHTNYPLTVIVSADHAITIKLSFQNKRFAAATVARIARHFTTLLAAIANDPAQSVTALPLLDDAERSLVVETFNDTRADYPADRCIQHLFEDQARVTPNATALVFEDRALSYARLDAEANRLAHRLQALGVGPETLVGVCAERSLEMVVALLATLKAGGAYLPLDPAYPADRLGFMLDDAKVPVLLTQQHLLPNLPKTDARIVCLDRDATTWAGMPATKPATTITADNLAYVIYTSGSTGRPKGAMNGHRAVVNRLWWMQSAYRLTAGERVLQKTPFSFDVSVWEFFWPLMTGATLVIARPEGHKDAAYLAELISRECVGTLHFVPSMMQAFLEAPEAAGCTTLTRVICSGEALPYELTRRLFAVLPGVELHNLYGPTECAVDVTAWTVPSDDTSGRVPIGRPVSNTQMYVLDQRLQPVPIGVPGELHIGGVQVGRGYLNRPELTAERFIADPFSSDPKARLYKTGDLARWLPDGTVDYLGRLDFQVKIRGFRIELGEIEAALARHAAVRDAVVLAREDRPGDKRLVAYVVGQPVDPIELRTHLRALLPDYMVPAAFVALEALPLNANGKLDRKALPAPDYTAPDSDSVAPATPTEAILADIVADVLGLDRVSPRDNFFERGGDSILLLQVIARARRAGLHLTARQVFEQQTIAGLAAVATTSGGVLAPQGAVTGPLPLTPIQHWFFDQQPTRAGHFNQSMLLRTDPALQPDALRRALDHLVRHHDALRLRFHPADGVWQQHNAAPADTDVVLERRSDADVEAAAAEAQASLDIANGPLIRAILFPRRLFIAIHHLAVDGVSWRILLEDLATAYAQALAGTPVALPRKTSAFRDWALRLRQHAASDAVAAETGWWENVADGATTSLPIDLRASDDANTAGSVDIVTVALDRDQTNALLHDVPPVYRTQINDVLLAALGLALGDWTGSTRVLVDLEGHGREPLFDDLDVSRTVGWFTSLFPVALDVADRDPGGALKSIKEQLRAIPNRGIGYGLLHYLRADALRDRPRAELCFNYLGQLDPADGPFAPVDEPTGPVHDPDLRRPHRIVVNSAVEAGTLVLNWEYSRTLHRRATIERLAQRYLEALGSIIHHCRQPTAGGFTPSDFPEAKLDQGQLDLVRSLLRRPKSLATTR